MWVVLNDMYAYVFKVYIYSSLNMLSADYTGISFTCLYIGLVHCPLSPTTLFSLKLQQELPFLTSLPTPVAIILW